MSTSTEDSQFEQLQPSICDPTSDFDAFTWLKKLNRAPQHAQPRHYGGHTPVDGGEFSSFLGQVRAEVQDECYPTHVPARPMSYGSLHNV